MARYAFRADQAEADELLGNNAPQTHLLRANFVWDLPDLRGDGGVMQTIGFVLNDWQLSGIWSAAHRRRLHHHGVATRTAATT